jgi:hypothetical protein
MGQHSGLDAWLDAQQILDGTPFLLSPGFEYDVDLNEFFSSWQMASTRPNTQISYARDLARFLSFLMSARGGRSWRDATEADHLAFWRGGDEIRLGRRSLGRPGIVRSRR